MQVEWGYKESKFWYWKYFLKFIRNQNPNLLKINRINEVYVEINTMLPLIFITSVHVPSPHPTFPTWQKTEIGFESIRSVTTLLTFSLEKKSDWIKLSKGVELVVCIHHFGIPFDYKLSGIPNLTGVSKKKRWLHSYPLYSFAFISLPARSRRSSLSFSFFYL